MKQKEFWSQKQLVKDQTGATLVELIASIAILALVVTSFLTFFVQSAKATQSSEQVTAATYSAQRHMEYLTHLSASMNAEEAIEALTNQYPVSSGNGLSRSFSFQDDGIEYALNLIDAHEEDSAHSDNYILLNATLIGSREGKIVIQLETSLPFEKGVKNE